MADLVLGERHLGALVKHDPGDRRRRNQQRTGLPVVAEVVGDIGGDDARPLQRPGNIDPRNARMRHLAAKKRDVQHSRQLDVVDE